MTLLSNESTVQLTHLEKHDPDGAVKEQVAEMDQWPS
jgi:hypothetical protein